MPPRSIREARAATSSLKTPNNLKPAFFLSGPGGTRYAIYVELPIRLRPGKMAPAIAWMDGDMLFAPAVKTYREMEAAAEVAPLFLIGVGYGVGFGKPGNERLRDYTPTSLKTEAGSGGAAAFHAFLTSTLWPELTRRYPIDPSIRGLAGHSLGSLLVLYALFQTKPFFNRFMASAPSIWWDDRAILDHAATLQAAGVSLPARLHLSSGAEDTESMTGDLVLMERQLALHPFPALEVASTRYLERDHYNVIPEATRGGLKFLLSQRPV
jgi:predicted alpha/beta superfamily hydrolase